MARVGTVTKQKMMNLTGMEPKPHQFNNKAFNQRCIHCGVVWKRDIADKPCFVKTRLEHNKSK